MVCVEGDCHPDASIIDWIIYVERNGVDPKTAEGYVRYVMHPGTMSKRNEDNSFSLDKDKISEMFKSKEVKRVDIQKFNTVVIPARKTKKTAKNLKEDKECFDADRMRLLLEIVVKVNNGKDEGTDLFTVVFGTRVNNWLEKAKIPTRESKLLKAAPMLQVPDDSFIVS